MWDKLEQVRELLPQIAHVSYYLESIFNLDRNLTLLSDENVDHHILKDIQIFQGANAYETAVAEGYAGTVTEWLESLRGPQGDPGPQGVADAATLAALQGAIDAAEASAAAASALATNVQSQLGLMAPATLLQALDDQVDIDIAASEASTLAAVNLLIDDFIDSTEAQTIAETVFASEIVSREALITANGASIATADALIAGLRTDHDALGTAYSAFVVQTATDVARIAVLEASDATNTAAIVSVQAVNASLASEQTTLIALTDTHEAEITSLQTASGNQATQINVLQVASATNGAAITTLQTASSDIDEAIATLQTNITANATATATAQTTADTAQTTADTAQTTADGAQADADTNAGAIAVNTAAISTEQTARADGDSANASSIATVLATAAGNTASIVTNATAIATIGGNLVARYAIVVDGGGNGSFISLEDGVSTPSKIELSASLIELNGNVIINGTLDTPQMADDSVSERLTTNDTSTRAIASDESLTELESVVYNKAEAGSDIVVSFHCRHEGSTAIAGDDYAVEIHIQRNGVSQTLGDFWYYREQGFPHSEFGSITVSGVPAGSSTWSLDMRASNGGGISGVIATRTQFIIEEVKK
jgi:hypothetical protein